MKRTVLLFVLVSVLILGFFSSLFAEKKEAIEYPTRPVTIIVPWGTGGMTDVSNRMLAEYLKVELGKPVIIVNKAGASGIIGLRAGLSEKPDGHTIIGGPMTLALTSPYFQDAEPFDVDKIKFVGSYMPQERILMAPHEAPYQTFDEFIEYVKAHPGEVSVGSGGAQWALEVMKSIAVKNNLKMKYVMFKSGGAASTAILGRHVDVCETGVGTPAYQACREGDLRILVDLGSESVPYFPEMKNLKELGYPFQTVLEYGWVVHGDVSEAIRQRLEDALEKIMQNPDLVEKMENIGFVPRFLPGKDYEKISRDAVKSIPELIEYNKALQ